MDHPDLGDEFSQPRCDQTCIAEIVIAVTMIILNSFFVSRIYLRLEMKIGLAIKILMITSLLHGFALILHAIQTIHQQSMDEVTCIIFTLISDFFDALVANILMLIALEVLLRALYREDYAKQIYIKFGFTIMAIASAMLTAWLPLLWFNNSAYSESQYADDLDPPYDCNQQINKSNSVGPHVFLASQLFIYICTGVTNFYTHVRVKALDSSPFVSVHSVLALKKSIRIALVLSLVVMILTIPHGILNSFGKYCNFVFKEAETAITCQAKISTAMNFSQVVFHSCGLVSPVVYIMMDRKFRKDIRRTIYKLLLSYRHLDNRDGQLMSLPDHVYMTEL